LRCIESRIYCSISGFGAAPAAAGTGRAMDSIIQALSGLMMTSGAPGDPPVRVGVPMADHPRIDRTASGVADAKSIERPRAEVLDDHVGVAEQVGKHVARARLLQVERDGVFSSQPVQCRHRHIVSRGRAEAHAMGAQKRRVLSAGIRRVRVLDLDDARTEAGEQERGKRTGQREGGIENRETGQRSSGGSGGVDGHQGERSLASPVARRPRHSLTAGQTSHVSGPDTAPVSSHPRVTITTQDGGPTIQHPAADRAAPFVCCELDSVYA
jgi:hypothetical protein